MLTTKHVQALAAVAVAILIAGVICLRTADAPARRIDNVLARVDGEPITIAEYRRQMSMEKPMVYDFFKKKYGVDDGPAFLDTPHGGEVPLDLLRKRALEAVVRTKVQQLLMKEKG